jgi:hypothetical protein
MMAHVVKTEEALPWSRTHTSESEEIWQLRNSTLPLVQSCEKSQHGTMSVSKNEEMITAGQSDA